MMIHKNDLKNKYVQYMDKEGKWRTEKVVRVSGNYLTVQTRVKIKKRWDFPKHRIHLSRVHGRYRKNGLEEIEWNGKLPVKKKRRR